MKRLICAFLFAFFLLINNQAWAQLVSGTFVTDYLATSTPPDPLDKKTYSIVLTAGQGATIQGSAGYDVRIEITPPGGVKQAGVYNRWITNSAPLSGTYTVDITARHYYNSGTFKLYYFAGGEGTSQGLIESGKSYTATMPTNGMLSYSFAGTAGQAIAIQTAGGNLRTTIRLYKPDGTYVNQTGDRWIPNNNLTVTGTYTLLVTGLTATDGGSMTLQFVKGGDETSYGLIKSGWTSNANLIANGMRSYSFMANAGEGFRINVDAPYPVYIRVYTPDGAYWNQTGNRWNTTGVVQSGKYTVVVDYQSITDSGDYSLYFFKGASSVSDGFLVNGSTAWPGYLNKNGLESYTFSATAGSNLTVTTTGSISRTFNIYTPDGAYWTWGTTTKSITASTTGTYSVVLFGAYDTTEGDYTISATSTPVATTASDQTKKLDSCAYAGNPINVDLGFKLQTDTDYDVAGLSFTRIYRSDSTWTNNTVGTLWRHNYARTLNVSGSAADITDESGAIMYYTLTGGVWVPNDPSTTSTLETITGGYKYTLHDGTVEKYDSTKKLMRIEYLGGGALNLAYNGSSQLTSVTNENGRQLTMGYTSGRVSSVVTPDGTFSYSYTSGNLTTVTKPDTKTTLYHYENVTYPNALTGITDEKGVRFATFAYNGSGKAISTEHAGTVDKYSVAYNTNSSTTTNPLGKDTTYQFRNILGVRRIVQVDGIASANCVAANKHYNYDELGRTIGKTDWENNTTRYRYDSRSNVIEVIEAAGTSKQRITDISWIAGFNLPDVVSEPGLTTDYDYDIYGRLVTMTQTDTATSETRITTYAYYSNGTDGSGNVILGRLQQVDGPRTDVSDITSYAYDGNYNLTTVTNALSQVTTVSARDSAGRPTTVQDANGINTVLTYDTNGWLQTATRASGTGLAALYDFDYDFNGNIVKVTLPNGVFVEYSYDNAQRLTGIKDSLNNTVTYTLNNAGDATKVEVKNATPTTTYVHDQAFDELSRLIRSIGAATPAQTAYFAYDKNSNLTSYTDPKANPATTYTYDALQRLATQTDSASGVTTLGYTALDDVNSVKDQRNNTTSYTYNAFGDVTSETSPDRGSIAYIVDKAGNVTKRTDARSVVTDYTYDALNRLLTVVYPAETALNATLSYDLSSGCGTPYKGHLCRVVDDTGTTNYQYDSLGRVTSVSETRGALTFNQSYTYDLAGNIATMTLPSGRVVTYTRNANGLVSNVAAPINGSATNLASSITYLPFGPQNAMTYGNGKTFSATYDTDYNPTNRTVSGGLYNWTYTTDKNSNITQAGATTYGYDVLDRVNAENPGTAASYTYDATSNRLTKVQGSTTTTTVPSTSNKISAVGGTSYTYDAAGNITAIGTSGYVWSAQGLMKEYKISGVSTATYTYNAYNQRTKKVTGGLTTHYIYDAGGLLIGEYTSAGAMVREYIYLNNAPLAQVNSGSPETATYIHTDHLGTPRFGTNTAGTQVWSWTNDAFGTSAPSGAATINLRMAGQYYDSESSLFYNWNRYYNPAIGRYISSDPIGLSGGLNTFAYANLSPQMYTDPYGLYSRYDLELDALDAWMNSLEGWAGLTDTLTFEQSKKFREAEGLEFVDPCGKSYNIGRYFGYALELVSAGKGFFEGGKWFLNRGLKNSGKLSGEADDVIHVTKDGVALPASPKYQIPENYIQNPNRAGSYGESINGKFVERLRIDPPTPPGQKGPNYSHYHLDKGRPHYSPRPGIPDPGF
jgi:RHS repeat-associated protein